MPSKVIPHLLDISRNEPFSEIQKKSFKSAFQMRLAEGSRSAVHFEYACIGQKLQRTSADKGTQDKKKLSSLLFVLRSPRRFFSSKSLVSILLEYLVSSYHSESCQKRAFLYYGWSIKTKFCREMLMLFIQEEFSQQYVHQLLG